MEEKEFMRLFNKQRRKKAYDYHNKKNKLLLFNNIFRLIVIVMFFYFNLEVKLFQFINQNLYVSLQLFFYILMVVFIYQTFNNILEFFTLYQLRKEYNLTAQSNKEWLQDRVKSFFLTLILTFLFSLLFLILTDSFFNNWWLIISLILSGFVVLLNYLLPVVFLPMFYSLQSYPEGELKDRLMSTFNKLDLEIEDIYEINLSSKMTSANAAVIGMGNTRKILLSDNLADRFSADEIEAVLCHEIGHHVNNDIYKNLLLQPFIIIITAFIVNLSWPSLINLFGYQSINPIVSIPLLLIFWGLLYSVFTPLQLYLSRIYEKRADQFAFEIIDDPMDLGRAFAKLADDSLARLEYYWWEKFYKASHPSIKSRIYQADQYKNRE